MANYFKDLRSGAKNLYRQAKGNATLKGVDDYFDRISAGGGKGIGDFMTDMSGIADMYQVGKQGAHIADDMYDGKDWDDIDQGRKDALGRGALGTALTLAPVPGIKMARAGLRAGTGAAKRGTGKAMSELFGHRGARKMLAPPSAAAPRKGVKKMREFLEKKVRKSPPPVGAFSTSGWNPTKALQHLGKASDKEVRKAYNLAKGIKTPGLGSRYMANASDNIFKKGIGPLTPLRAAMGSPLYRAGKVGLKDLYRGTPEGYEDSEDLLSEAGHPGNAGTEGEAGPAGATGREAAEAALESINRARAEQGLPPETLDGQYFPDEDATLANASEAPGGIRKVLSEIESAPGYAEKSKNASGQLNKTGGPIYDPRRGEYVRAESLTDEEQAAFAEVTAEKNGERNMRLNTHDEKGRLHDNVDRYAIDRQNQARKSYKDVQGGYNRDDDMREIMRANGISGDGGFRGEPGELGRVPTGSGVEDFRRRNIESSRIPEGYSSSANRGLSDMDIHKLVSAQKVAMSNAERPPLTSEEMLNEEDNPFNFEKARAQEGRDFEELYESGAFEDDMSEPVGGRQPIDGGTRSIYDNWPTVPEDHGTTDYVDPSKGPGPQLSGIDTATTDYVDPNEPMPDPDAEAERWNRENPFAGAGEPSSAPPPSLGDVGPPPKRPTQNAPLNFDEEYPDGPEDWMFRPAIDPSTNGTSTTIRDLNNPAGGQEPSIFEELIRELEALGY